MPRLKMTKLTPQHVLLALQDVEETVKAIRTVLESGALGRIRTPQSGSTAGGFVASEPTNRVGACPVARGTCYPFGRLAPITRQCVLVTRSGKTPRPARRPR